MSKTRNIGVDGSFAASKTVKGVGLAAEKKKRGEGGGESSSLTMKQELLTTALDWSAYALAWSNVAAEPRIAVGSYVEEGKNAVQIYDISFFAGGKDGEGGGGGASLVKSRGFDLSFPATKLLWHPKHCQTLASAGDHLRLWNVKSGEEGNKTDSGCSSSSTSSSGRSKTNEIKSTKETTPTKCEQKTVLENEAFAPLTSMDWNHQDEHIIGATNYNEKQFSCTIWNVHAEKRETDIQLKGVDRGARAYDIEFRPLGRDIFGTVSADGRVRVFDMRSLNRVAVVHEATDPLVRVAWNVQNPIYVAALKTKTDSATNTKSNEVVVLDLRSSETPLLTLSGHASRVNAIAWAPHSATHICTVGDDKQSHIWNISHPRAVEEPILTYSTREKISNVAWPSTNEACLALTSGARLEVLRV